jgi:hypothetical protein
MSFVPNMLMVLRSTALLAYFYTGKLWIVFSQSDVTCKVLNMKETLILLMTILFFSSCNSRNRESDKDKQLQKGSANINSIVNNLSRSLNENTIPPTKIDGLRALSFKFNVDSSGYLLRTIDIYSDNKLIQRIIANKDIERNEFQLIDWNFDGYKDISVLYNCGSGGCAYWIWNYSSKVNRYIYNNELSEVLGLEIDTTDKYIVCHYRAGYSEEYWDSMQYKDSKLLFVKGLYRQRWNDSLGNSWVKNTYSKMINKVMITKTDSFITK